MSEEERKIPKPDIKPTPKPNIKPIPPTKPPVTTADSAPAPKETPPPLEPEEPESPAPDPSGVETDLVKRFLGVFIDAVVASVIAGIIGSFAGSFLQIVVWAVIFLTRDSLPMLEGQSLGKKVMKTKAVREDGSDLTGDWATGATRNVLLAIPFAGIVECFIILSRSGKPDAGLRLGDDWAKTKVISVD